MKLIKKNAEKKEKRYNNNQPPRCTISCTDTQTHKHTDTHHTNQLTLPKQQQKKENINHLFSHIFLLLAVFPFMNSSPWKNGERRRRIRNTVPSYPPKACKDAGVQMITGSLRTKEIKTIHPTPLQPLLSTSLFF